MPARVDARPVPREPWARVLFPLSLLAYAAGALLLLAVSAQLVSVVGSIGSTDPVTMTLPASVDLPAAAGTHDFSGSPHIEDGVQVRAAEVQAEVSGLDAGTRSLVQLGPLLWSLTLLVVVTAAGLVLARLRRDDPVKPASRPMLLAAAALAVGSTAAQLVTAWAGIRVGHVAWDGAGGISGFRAVPDSVFDATPLVVAAAFLALVLVIRRSEARSSDA